MRVKCLITGKLGTITLIVGREHFIRWDDGSDDVRDSADDDFMMA